MSKKKILSNLKKQTAHKKDIKIIKDIVNTINSANLFQNLVVVHWENGERVYSLREDAKSLIKLFTSYKGERG